MREKEHIEMILLDLLELVDMIRLEKLRTRREAALEKTRSWWSKRETVMIDVSDFGMV